MGHIVAGWVGVVFVHLACWVSHSLDLIWLGCMDGGLQDTLFSAALCPFLSLKVVSYARDTRMPRAPLCRYSAFEFIHSLLYYRSYLHKPWSGKKRPLFCLFWIWI
jgi:hypothetical protein